MLARIESLIWVCDVCLNFFGRQLLYSVTSTIQCTCIMSRWWWLLPLLPIWVISLELSLKASISITLISSLRYFDSRYHLEGLHLYISGQDKNGWFKHFYSKHNQITYTQAPSFMTSLPWTSILNKNFVHSTTLIPIAIIWWYWVITVQCTAQFDWVIETLKLNLLL